MMMILVDCRNRESFQRDAPSKIATAEGVLDELVNNILIETALAVINLIFVFMVNAEFKIQFQPFSSLLREFQGLE